MMTASSANNIILVGFMGTGKSAVGQELARQLARRFVDMDEELAARAGKSIALIFAEEGEAAFRAMERELVRELVQARGQVIATGGGVVLNQANLKDFSATGSLVCLSASPEEILRRVAGATQRPLLNQPDPAAVVRQLLAQRQQLYAAIPIQINTTGLSVGEVVAAIRARLADRAAL
ncbi:MAG: shikimate kinase [Lentisphaerae bacterium]|nr:shikimate kinase [Lentisphaerota bacterium]